MEQRQHKFTLKCNFCECVIAGFPVWFAYRQRCPECGSDQTEVVYNHASSRLAEALRCPAPLKPGMWRYSDFLPLLDNKNIISCGEGDVAINRWSFLETLANSHYNVNCRVFAHRQDNNYATGTFKDLAGSMIASILKENGITAYVVSTTGNIGVAYARYASDAKINLYVFIPENSSISQEAEIGCFGHKVFRVKGDYASAKQIAAEFAQAKNILLAAGNFDPMRIEAKKTMAYEWLRLMPAFPTVYVQALSGGTGPLGVAKAYKELCENNFKVALPRFLLVQSDHCSPMADAWQQAKTAGFPSGWNESFPIYHNPNTSVPTLATGNPKTYPVVSKLVRESDGEIISFPEQHAATIARLVAYESAVRIGPAAAIAVGGFLTSLKRGYIRDHDIVLLNIGEGIRRAPEFMKELALTTSTVSSVDDCSLFDRNTYGRDLWEAVDDLLEC